ncbi:hypothetical protein [Brevibacillus brevis]|uniref:CopG family transcriptional regulator n=1 Tax=Brevibacillus brevis TaxID=1393 RepID=A0ABY9TCM8_BREBE|nr:hypothetical protein [Brevibacillus brevis]WNC17858.1 hypothetical protein RGB73_30075 [Brevibacillus brevis]
MGGKLKPEEEKKVRITLGLSKWVVDLLKKENNMSGLVEMLLIEHFEKKR